MVYSQGMRYTRYKFCRDRTKTKDTLFGKESTFHLYLGFQSRDFPVSSHRDPLMPYKRHEFVVIGK
jgi:hypothetical protein